MDGLTDARIAAVIRTLADQRAGRSFCPSEAARALTDDWRPVMPDVRRVAAGLADIKATQKGQEVDPLTARGPIRLARR
ncbi:DUF3253 domain-containing protein [Jannaschia aquimarina]|uniref:S-adenosylmethionine tRNA ribosyltransferase n=1 Tax=Jannaschia aquimarina TaxID=935700 RepID=A0A0D1EC89_9RHOB|nr:DUF3253 domain-containing protein [Jannaschia aquimarina]KIT14536.1 hypothetical protein jaqu_38260 [Jannaschia aquimarina]SNT35549.1 Protein of unknown function [Jannaschia aquimarina]